LSDAQVEATPPARIGPRIVWTALRITLWLVLFAVLSNGGAWLYAQVPLPFEGPAALLQTIVALLAAIGAGFILLRWLDHRPLSSLGFGLTATQGKLFTFGLAIGGGVLLLVVGVMLGFGWLDFRGDSGTLGGWLATLVRDFVLLGIAAAAEEAMFRGYAFQRLAQGAGPWPALLLTSAGFAWAHANNPSVGNVALFNIFLAGLLLGAAYLLTKSLWFATAIHIGWNWAMASLADLPVSGLEILNTPLYEPQLSGPEWFTGGAFGPEGGFAGTAAFTAAIVAVWWLGRKRQYGNDQLESA
jgi:membrane protease YdiL (CAAX protease family)